MGWSRLAPLTVAVEDDATVAQSKGLKTMWGKEGIQIGWGSLAQGIRAQAWGGYCVCVCVCKSEYGKESNCQGEQCNERSH